MKVLYLAPPRRTPDRLTAFSFVNEEIVALARRGIDVFVLTYSLADDQEEMPSHPGVHLRELPKGQSIQEYRRTLQFVLSTRQLIPAQNFLRPHLIYHMARIERFAADLVREEGINLIHSNFAWPDGYGGMLAKSVTGCPVVTNLRGMDVIIDRSIDYGLRLGRSYDRALRALLATADRTTHVSDYIRDLAIELGAPAERACTVRKGVDCDHFRPQPRTAATTPTILTVAGLIPRKGINYIVRALSKLAASHDFRLVIAGDGPERTNLEALAFEVGLETRVAFTGQVGRDQIQNLFASSDIFILGSIKEASGNVLLEASASGCPVVCSASGGAPEYVEDGVTGFIVPARDPRAMAERIAQLLDEPALRERMGSAARAMAADRFTYARFIDDIVAIYQDVTGIEFRHAA